MERGSCRPTEAKRAHQDTPAASPATFPELRGCPTPSDLLEAEDREGCACARQGVADAARLGEVRVGVAIMVVARGRGRGQEGLDDAFDEKDDQTRDVPKDETRPQREPDPEDTRQHDVDHEEDDEAGEVSGDQMADAKTREEAEDPTEQGPSADVVACPNPV